MHGRLLRLSARDLAQMQYSHKRFVMDFYLHFFFAFFFGSNLDFDSDPSQIFRFLAYLTKITFWDLKSGFPIPIGIASGFDRDCVGIRDFQAKSG